MYHHLSQQNPTLTHRPVILDASKIHPAFVTNQPMIPQRHIQYQQQRSKHQLQPNNTNHNNNNNNNSIQGDPFDSAINSPIFHGYVSVPPLPPKL